MSQVAPRAIALQEANKLGLTDADSVLAAARDFVDFILAGDVPTPARLAGNVPSPAPAQPAAPKSAAPNPVKIAKPVAAQNPVKIAKPADAPKPAPEVASTGSTSGFASVKSVVDGLLAAGKRDEAVALLKKFGATSVSGVKAAVAEDFIAEGTAILNGEDLTS